MRLLQTLRKREERGLEAPNAAWFNSGQHMLLRALIKGRYVVDSGNGVRLTDKGRALVTPSPAQIKSEKPDGDVG